MAEVITPTDDQEAAIQAALASDKPVCWLGAVRAGKTWGACMALLEAMERRPGHYFVTAYGSSNLVRNLIPTLKTIMDNWELDYLERKAHPKHIDTDNGRISFFVGSDSSAEKHLQGITFQGGVSDEIVLYPKSFVMQIVARFSHEQPFWIMTANKSSPRHWIKTEWIDQGKVLEINSKTDDNPHISEDAKSWHQMLITGHHAERMISNDWSGEYRNVAMPKLLEKRADVPRNAEKWNSFYLDDARGYVAVGGIFHLGIVTVQDKMEFENMAEVMDYALSCKKGIIKIANSSEGNNPPMDRTAFIRTRVTTWAETLSRHGAALHFNPDMKGLWASFDHWLWVSSQGDTTYRPDSTDPHTLAVAMVFHNLCHRLKPIPINAGSMA